MLFLGIFDRKGEGGGLIFGTHSGIKDEDIQDTIQTFPRTMGHWSEAGGRRPPLSKQSTGRFLKLHISFPILRLLDSGWYSTELAFAPLAGGRRPP